MVIIGRMMFPPQSTKEVGKRFLALKTLPDYITRRGPYVNRARGEGVQTITIYECDKSKLAEAYNLVSDRHATFFEVPGFTDSVEVWLDATEALKLIGLA